MKMTAWTVVLCALLATSAEALLLRRGAWCSGKARAGSARCELAAERDKLAGLKHEKQALEQQLAKAAARDADACAAAARARRRRRGARRRRQWTTCLRTTSLGDESGMRCARR